MNNAEKEEPIKRNPAWSEDYASGYKNGYMSAKSHWETVMKNALEEKSRERVNLLRVYPYNLIPLINGEDDESDIRAWEENNNVYYSPRLIEEVMTQHLTERENKVLQMRYEWGMSLEEVGREIGVTRERIRQVEARAIRKMRMYKRNIMCAPAIDYRKELSDNEIESIVHPPILNDAEKQYLSAVIKPFRNEKLEIVKLSACNGSEEWLNFVSEKSSFYLPNFKTGTMYKGMERGHKYSPKELGL